MIFKKYKIKNINKRKVSVDIKLVIENYCDFDHVNYVHKRCYNYCKVIRRQGNTTFLEYGVYHIPPIPIIHHYEMEHKFISPNRIIYTSNRKGSKDKVIGEIYFEQKGNETEIIQIHNFSLPMILKPFEFFIKILLNRWSQILWDEDSEMMENRKNFIENGYKDGFHCGRWVNENGNIFWKFNKKN